MKRIKVSISETLSSTQTIMLPDDADIENMEVLKEAVFEQIVLPSDCVEYEGYATNWCIDDLCVIYE